ncbi:hypothetical protein [Pseudarthrobacter sulfonivorans]|uniref:hypothetical protein n=1 Tax=Pseudarthrobacter sulfonivorans TaxID=121292 RepID=UPI0012FDC3B1|nr:hypothetical protein [Pseudarthrobacter sulfonivorans]
MEVFPLLVGTLEGNDDGGILRRRRRSVPGWSPLKTALTGLEVLPWNYCAA